MRYQDTIKYKVVRTSEEPVELVNGTQTGVYDVEFWQFNYRAKRFLFNRTVQSDFTFEEATAVRHYLNGILYRHKERVSALHRSSSA